FSFFTDLSPTSIYTLSLHDALPIFTSVGPYVEGQALARSKDRSLGVMVWGVDPDHPQAIADLDKFLWQAKATELKACGWSGSTRSEEHTSELQSRGHLVCRLLLEKK